jgi:hypothetical protein
VNVSTITQNAHRSTVCHPVMEEVDRPLLVRPNGRKQWLSQAHQALSLLAPDTQPGSTIHPEEPFVIHNLPLSAQENRQAAIALARLLVR